MTSRAVRIAEILGRNIRSTGGLLFYLTLILSVSTHASTLTPQIHAANEQHQQSSAKPASGPGWVARCMSESRQAPIECAMEESAVLTNTGQLMTSVVVRIPSNTHSPIMIIQLPFGLYLPAGLNLQIDGGTPQSVPVKTCEPKGCFAEMQISSTLLAALKSGKRLSLTFQNLEKKNVVVTLVLDNFADTFQKIQ